MDMFAITRFWHCLIWESPCLCFSSRCSVQIDTPDGTGQCRASDISGCVNATYIINMKHGRPLARCWRDWRLTGSTHSDGHHCPATCKPDQWSNRQCILLHSTDTDATGRSRNYSRYINCDGGFKSRRNACCLCILKVVTDSFTLHKNWKYFQPLFNIP